MNTKAKQLLGIVAGILSLVVFMSANASAYELNGNVWPGSHPRTPYYVSTNLQGNIPYDDSASFETVQDHIWYAADTWNTQGDSNFQFTYAGTTDVTQVADDGINAVVFDSGQCPIYGCRAITYYHQTNGVFRGFDIVLYKYRGDTATRTLWKTEMTYPTQTDLWSLMAHEFGHALGLDHSEWPDVVMGTNCGPGCASRNLYADDIEGAQAVYGSYEHEGFESNIITAQPGDTITLNLHYGYAFDKKYEVLLSLSGMDGTSMRTLDPDLLSDSPFSIPDSTDSRILPINSDFFPVADHPEIFQNFFGTLDAQGEATATITVPEDFALLGNQLYLSVVTYDDHTPSPNSCNSPSCVEDVGVGVFVQLFPAGVPTVSEWGMVVMTLLLMTLGTVMIGRRRKAPM